MEALEADLCEFWESALGQLCREACDLEHISLETLPRGRTVRGRNYANIYRGLQAQGLVGIAKAIVYRCILDWRNMPKDAVATSEELGF